MDLNPDPTSTTNFSRSMTQDLSFRMTQVKAPGPDGTNRIVSMEVYSTGLLILTQDNNPPSGRVLYAPSTANLTIFADVLRIRGPIVAKGCAITVFARRIEVEKDSGDHPASIDVSAPEFTGKAYNGDSNDWAQGASVGNPGTVKHPGGQSGCTQEAWENLKAHGWLPSDLASKLPKFAPLRGLDGLDPDGVTGKGTDGRDAGSVTLWALEFEQVLATDPDDGPALSISANGGSGTTGRAGQDGGRGGDGWSSSHEHYQEGGLDGGNAGNGGDGGNGADGGNGGAGGRVEVRSISCTDASKPSIKLSFDVAGGLPGSGGAGGLPGGPGNPGAECVIEGGYSQGYMGSPGRWIKGKKGKPGAAGHPGTAGHPGNEGGNGETGAISTDPLLPGLFAASIPGDYLNMVLERIRTLFIVRRGTAGGGSDASGTTTDSSSASALDSGSGEGDRLLRWVLMLADADNDTRPTRAERERAYTQARLTANFHRQDRDWMGNLPEFVPLLSKGILTADADAMFENLCRVYDDLQQVQSMSDELTERCKELSNSIAGSQSRGASLREAIVSQTQRLDQQLGLVKVLDQNASTARRGVMAALDGLEDAMNGKLDLQWSDISNVLQNLSFISAENPVQGLLMGASQYGNLVDAAVSKIHDDTGQSVDRAYVVRKVAVLSSDFSSLKEGIKQFSSGALESEDPNSSKLLMTRDELNSVLDGFQSWSEGRLARQKLDEYVEREARRNEAILDYNAILAHTIDLMNERDIEVARTASLTSERADAPAPGILAKRNYLASAFEQHKVLYLRRVSLLVRACAFWSLDPNQTLGQLLSDLQVSDLGMIDKDVLETIHNKVYGYRLANGVIQTGIADQILDAFASCARQRMPEVLVRVTEDSHPEEIRRLRDGSSMAFSIAIPLPTDSSAPFNAMRDVRITTVRVWLRGTLGKQAYLAIITHCGKELLQAPSGPVMTATHVPQRRQFRAQLGDPPRILVDGTFVAEDAELYMQVGPFATWNIEIAPCQNADGVPLDLSKLQEVHLCFSGKFRSPSSPS